MRYLILDALGEQPRHGYEIIRFIESRSGGAYRPSPGTVYPTLQMLEEMGQVQAVERDGRKVYEITDEGRAELDAHQDDVDQAYDRFGGGGHWGERPELHELWDRIHRMLRSMGRGWRWGGVDASKLRDIEKVIGEAAERVEEILRR